MINAGDLKHRFKIEINTKTVDDQGGFDSSWQTLGYFWAKVDNKALKRTNTNGELIHTQDMTLHIRQKQRFDICPINSRDYRLTDKRGNMYQIVNFEQSDFDLNFYGVSVVQAGHTNEPFGVTDPCAGATTNIIIDVSAEYDVYINDELIFSGEYAVIFEVLLFTQDLVWDTSGLLTSYRDATARLRFERTDGQAIDFDGNGNPTANLAGSVLSFCLAGQAWADGLLTKFGGLLSEPDDQGFVTLSPNPATCANEDSEFIAASKGAVTVQYRYPDLVPDNVHSIANFTNASGSGQLRFQNRATGNSIGVTWSLGSGVVQQIIIPPPSFGTIITLQVDAVGATVSYTGYSETLPHPADFEPLSSPAFGLIWFASLARGIDQSLTTCDRQPMEIKI